MDWICPLYKLSTCWGQRVERIWRRCWEVLSLVESNLKLAKLFAQHGSIFPLFRGHPCVAQQSRVHLHNSAQHAEPTLGAVPSVSKDSQPWFNMSLCEIFGMLNMLSHRWGPNKTCHKTLPLCLATGIWNLAPKVSSFELAPPCR